MNCKNCGMETEEGAAFCTNCGTPVAAPQPEPIPEPKAVPAPKQAAADPGKALGIVSLILGIVSMVSLGFPAASVVGIILGSIGKKKSAEAGFVNSPAKIGTILSIIGLVLFVLAMVVYVVYYIFIIGMAGAMSSAPYYY